MAEKRANQVASTKGIKKIKKSATPNNVPIKKLKKNIKVVSKTLNYTLCIPTSILSNCHNLEQITYTVYQIAKAATIFNVGEVVVLDLGDDKRKTRNKDSLSDAMLIASLLQYFVTPPYLVNTVFKKQYRKYFKEAGNLPRLSSLPFMRYLEQDNGRYREGLAIRMTKPRAHEGKKKAKEFKQTKFINIGKEQALELKAQLVPVNVRVTVDIVERRVVSPEEAYGDFVGANASYGYHVRVAKTFGSIFTECAFPEGYSQAIWINSGDYYYNEKLKKYHKMETKLPYLDKIIKQEPTSIEGENQNTQQEKKLANVLIVCGKWDHMKQSFEKSKDQFEGCDSPHQFFDAQIELPGTAPQGNITIQDSCMISLSIISTL